MKPASGGAERPHHDNGDRAIASARPDRILRLTAVLDRTGLSRSTLYRKIEEGTFPSQVRIAARCVGWRESAVMAWLDKPAV
jgi:prophage regulatory protein